ncbi:uncharacterized protein LOC115210682 [Argonauta hians]
MEQNSNNPAIDTKPRRGRPRKKENDKNKLHHIRLRKSKPRAVKVIAPTDPLNRVKKSTATKTSLKAQPDKTQTTLSISPPVEPHTSAAIKSNIHSLITITSPTNGTKKLLLLTDKTYPTDFHSMKINCKPSNVTSTCMSTTTTTTTTTATTSVSDNSNNKILYQIPNNKKPGMVILTAGTQTPTKMQPKQFLLIPTSGTTDISLLNPSLTAVSSSQNKLIASKAAISADRVNQAVTTSCDNTLLVKADSSDTPHSTAAVMTISNKERNVGVKKPVSVLSRSVDNTHDYATKCARLRESVENFRGNKDVNGTLENSIVNPGSTNLQIASLKQKCFPLTHENNGVDFSSCEKNGSNPQNCHFSSVDTVKSSLNSPTVPHVSSGLSSDKSESISQSNSISQRKVDPKRPYGPRARKSFPKVYDRPASIISTVSFSPTTSQSLWSVAPSYSTSSSSSIPDYSLHSQSQSFISGHPPFPTTFTNYQHTLTHVTPCRNISINHNDSNNCPINSPDLNMPPVPFKRQVYSSPPKLTIAPGFLPDKSKQKNVRDSQSPSDIMVIKEREEFFGDEDGGCTSTNIPGDMSPPKLEREDGFGCQQADVYPLNLKPQHQTNNQLTPIVPQNHTENMAPSLPDRTKYAAGLKKNRKLSFGKLFSSMLSKSSKYRKSLNHYTILFEIARSIHCCVVLTEFGFYNSVDLNDLPYKVLKSLKCSKRCRQKFMKTASNVGALPLVKRVPNAPVINDGKQSMIRRYQKPGILQSNNLVNPIEHKSVVQSNTSQVKHTSGNYALIKQPELRNNCVVQAHATVVKPFGNPNVQNTPHTTSSHSRNLDTEHNYFKLSNDKMTTNCTRPCADVNNDSINKGSLPIINNCGNEIVPNPLKTFSTTVPPYNNNNNTAMNYKAVTSNTGALMTSTGAAVPPPSFSTEKSIIGKLKYEVVSKEKLLSMNSTSNMIPVVKNPGDVCKNGILKGNSNNQLMQKNMEYKDLGDLQKTTKSESGNVSSLAKNPEQLLKPSKSEIAVKNSNKVVRNKSEMKRKTFDERMQLLKENECFMNNNIKSTLSNNLLSKLQTKKNIKKETPYEHAPSLEDVKSIYNEPTTTDRVVMLDPKEKLLLQQRLEKPKKIPKKRGRPPKDRSSNLSINPCMKTQFGNPLSKRKGKKAKLQRIKSSGSINLLILEIENRLAANHGSISRDIKPGPQCAKKSNIENIIKTIYTVPSHKKKLWSALRRSKLKSGRRKPVNWKKIARQPLKSHDLPESVFDVRSLKSARKFISTVTTYSQDSALVICKTELPNDLINTQNVNECQTSLSNLSALKNPCPPVRKRGRPPVRKRGRPPKAKIIKLEPVSETLDYDHSTQIGISPCDNSPIKNSSAVSRKRILPTTRKGKRKKILKQRGKRCLPARTARPVRNCSKLLSFKSVSSTLDDHSSNLDTDIDATETKEVRPPVKRRKRKTKRVWLERREMSRRYLKRDILEPQQVQMLPYNKAGKNTAIESKLPLVKDSSSSNGNLKKYVLDNVNKDKTHDPSKNYGIVSKNNVFKKHDCKKTFDAISELPCSSSSLPIGSKNSPDITRLVPSKSTCLQQPSSLSLDNSECDNLSDDSERTLTDVEDGVPCESEPDDTENSFKSFPLSPSMKQPSTSYSPANDNSFTPQHKYSDTDQETNIISPHHSALLNKFNVGLTPELARIQRLKDMLEQQKKTIDIVKQKLS